MSQEPKTYSLTQVTVALVLGLWLGSMLAARNLVRWSERLPPSQRTAALHGALEQLWGLAVELGLEAPGLRLERWWLEATDAPKQAQPRSYEETMAQRLAKSMGPAAVPNFPREVMDDETRKTFADAVGPKVLVIGDSLMMTVGPVIKKDVSGRLKGAALVKAKLATGLARPDVMDWTKEVRRLTATRRFDYLVVMLGANDAQDFSDDGAVLTYGTAPWVKAYAKRLSALMATGCRGATTMVWLGLPPMRSPQFQRKAQRLNAVAKREAEQHGCVEFVATDAVIGDEGGRFASYRRIDNRLEKVRTVDGIHVTARGGTLISGALVQLMTSGVTVGH